MNKKNLIDAGRLERLFANLIDTLILLAPHALLVKFFGTGGPSLMVGFLCNLAYFVHFTASDWQASPGQRLLNIYVIHQDGTRLGVADSLERFLAYVMPTLPMYTSVVPDELAPAITIWLSLLWFAPIVISDRRTGVHDRLCKTRVVVGKGEVA